MPQNSDTAKELERKVEGAVDAYRGLTQEYQDGDYGT